MNIMRKLTLSAVLAVSLVSLLAGLAGAQPPKTFAFLEERVVEVGEINDIGPFYEVPPGRKATVSGMMCEVRSMYTRSGGYIALVTSNQDSNTVRGPKTPTFGMNTIYCYNANEEFHTKNMTGATLTLMPGDYILTFAGNPSQDNIFVMLSAWVLEEDLH